MARRARRGLADLSDSEGDDCNTKETDSIKENSCSLFDTKVFTENVLSKIREEEAKVTIIEDLKKNTDQNETITTIDESPEPSPRTKRCSQRAAKRCKLVELLDSDGDEDELDELLKSTSATNAAMTAPPQCCETMDLDGGDRANRTRKNRDTDDEDDTFLNESQDENDELNVEDQNDYRILVKHLGVDGGIWVRVKEKETMQRVFDETRQAMGVGVTLMIDINGEREEVLPTHTAVDLRMSIERCAVIYSYPVPADAEDSSDADDENEEAKFKLKFVTTNRRATKEIVCERDETFGQIFQRYCEQNDLLRSSVVFKFDGDVLDNAQTPQEHDMESGEQIEAHDAAEMRVPTPQTECLENGRRVSARRRNRCPIP